MFFNVAVVTEEFLIVCEDMFVQLKKNTAKSKQSLRVGNWSLKIV